jgi:hypothetical protein
MIESVVQANIPDKILGYYIGINLLIYDSCNAKGAMFVK